MLTSRSFASDNNSGVLPEVLSFLSKVNQNHVAAYGNDPITSKTKEIFQEVFGPCDPYFVFNGTAANILCLSPFLKPFESIICSEDSHLHQNECQASERLLGIKLHTLATPHGKLKDKQIKEFLQKQRHGDPHCCQPRMISLTQPTELGTVYSLEELKQISHLAKEWNLFLHIDGSRLVNAASALKQSLKAITADVGVDCVSFGGTKNGLMLAEVALFFNPHNKQNIPYYQKQLLQLAGKNRFVAAQFYVFLKDELWKKYALHANQTAQQLASQVTNLSHVQIIHPVETNAIFAQIPRAILKEARKHFFFYLWDEGDLASCKNEDSTCIVRWMTTFDTSEKDLQTFYKDLTLSQ